MAAPKAKEPVELTNEELMELCRARGLKVMTTKPKVDPEALKNAKRAVEAILARDEFKGITVGMINVFNEGGMPRYKHPQTGEIYQHKGGPGAKKPEWATKANRIKD